MTVFYPDVSNNQWGSTELTTAGQQALMDFLSVLRGQGLSGVSHKMSEGADFIDPYGVVCQTWCKTNVFPFIGYHFATSDDAAAQVRNWKAAGGGANVLIDFEAAGVSMATFWDLVFAFNAARINVALAYIPQWFADQIGADLSQFAQSGIALVSSAYPMSHWGGPPFDLYRGCGGDSGEGWAPYLGALPTVWQFSDCARIGGLSVDINAYHGTSIQLAQLFTG